MNIEEEDCRHNLERSQARIFRKLLALEQQKRFREFSCVCRRIQVQYEAQVIDKNCAVKRVKNLMKCKPWLLRRR